MLKFTLLILNTEKQRKIIFMDTSLETMFLQKKQMFQSSGWEQYEKYSDDLDLWL